MDASEMIKQCREFLESRNTTKTKKPIIIKFKEILEFSPEIAELVEKDSNDFIRSLQEAYMDMFDVDLDTMPEFRIKDLPDSFKTPIGAIRKEHIDLFKQFEGTVIRVGDVRVMPKNIKFECPSCGNVLNVLQFDEDELKVPTKCGCGRKGKFRTLRIEWKNIQIIYVEEWITDYTDKKARPTTIKVILEKGLAENENVTKKIQPGKHIIFTGAVETKQVRKGNMKTAFFDFQIRANYIKVEDVSLFNIKIPKDYVERFSKMDRQNILKDLSDSLFFGIEGQDKVKEVLTISCARGVKTFKQDGKLDQRDTINIFMIGDPGSGKTDLAKATIMANIIKMRISGKGVSGVGMTAATLQDKNLGCYVVEPGAFPRCNKGTIVIDEIDKIKDEDTSHLNDGMNELSFTISKAGQNVTLESDVNVIACSNPEGRRFTNYEDKYREIPIQPDLEDRFDMSICVIKDDKEDAQKRIIKKIIDRFDTSGKDLDCKYDIKFIQYYFAWIIQNFKPTINEEVRDYTIEQISKLMGGKVGSKDISYRLVGNIIRFSQAIAKIEQEKEVKKHHVDRSIGLFIYSFESLDRLDPSGKVDIEKVNRQEDPNEIIKKHSLLDLILDKYEETKKALSYEDIDKLWTDAGHDAKEVDKLISKLSQRGDILESKRGFFTPM